MFEVHLKGFKTKEQAQAFVDWYSNSGEQDASQDFENRYEEGTLDVMSMNSGITSQETKPDGTGVITVRLELYGPEDE